jgi:F0F1-type ATP synthase assembly protein I
MPFNRPIPESKPPSKAASGLSAYVEAEKLMQIAFVLPSAVVIGWLAGWCADKLLHQSWIEIAGVIFGCVSGLTLMIRMAMDAEKRSRPGNRVQNGSGKGTPSLKP